MNSPVDIRAWMRHVRRSIARSARIRSIRIGGAILSLILLIALVGPFVYRASPNRVDIASAFASPSSRHPLGTDDLGRDVLSRVIYGGRISIASGITAVL